MYHWLADYKPVLCCCLYCCSACLTHAATTALHGSVTIKLRNSIQVHFSHKPPNILSYLIFTPNGNAHRALTLQPLCPPGPFPRTDLSFSTHCFSGNAGFCPKSLFSLCCRQGVLPPLENFIPSLNSIPFPQPCWQSLVLAACRKCPLCSLNEVCGSPPH